MIEGDQEAGVPQSAAYADGALGYCSISGLQVSELPDSEYLALADTIETEVIPRLLRAHRSEPRLSREKPVRTGLERNAIAEFASLIIHQDADVIRRFVGALLAGGATLEAIYLDLLAPTAGYLGDLWWADTCTFTDVTLGLFKLQGLLREYGRGSRKECLQKGDDALLLAAVPGSQHIFGFLMVEEFFRRAGWNVSSIPAATADEIVEAVRCEWFAAIGLSMSSNAYAEDLPALITTLRRVSSNRAIVVLVGGGFFNDNPEQVALVGADATAINARDAVVQAKRLLTAVARN